MSRVVRDFHNLNALKSLGGPINYRRENGQIHVLHVLSLSSELLQLINQEEGRHLTVFRDAEGKPWAYVRYGFALKIVPSRWAKRHESQGKWSEQLAQDIVISTRTVENQLDFTRETFVCLRENKLSVNMPRSEFCFAVVEQLWYDRLSLR